uniref:Uncharacterized protein n=1 Tax=Cannabis sativa TaxID=3483 RepID=A0A803RBZ2_CANSA
MSFWVECFGHNQRFSRKGAVGLGQRRSGLSGHVLDPRILMGLVGLIEVGRVIGRRGWCFVGTVREG